MQKYLGSMEGAVLSGKQAAEVITQDFPVTNNNFPTQTDEKVLVS